MKKYEGIISFDLTKGRDSIVDVSKYFPIAELHVIRSTKPLLDTLKKQKSQALDLSLPLILSIPRYTTFTTLDIGDPALAYKRSLSPSPSGKKRGTTIDLFPKLSIPYGALDVRGEPLISERKYGDIYRRSLPVSLHARRVFRDTSRFLRNKRRPIAIFLTLMVSLTLPVLFYTKSLVEHAYADMLSLKNSTNATESIGIIKKSRGNFERANLLFMPFRIFPGENIELAKIAIDGGLALSRGADTIASSFPDAQSGSMLIQASDQQNSLYRPIAKDIHPLSFLGIEKPTQWMKEHREEILYLKSSLSDAGEIYAKAENIEHPRAEEIAHIGRGLSKISTVLDEYIQNEPDIHRLLGADTPERYIVLNQNRDEIRTNGGFPGTVITFTLFRGNIEDYRTDDVYYYDWNLYPFKEIPPPGLALISGNYGLRDVNYYPDFHETLEKANTFIEKSGDPTVTVGIALHQGIIEDMLKVVGPVSLSGVTETFRADNFSLLMSTLVESRYGEETSAKDILRKFVDAFMQKVHEERAYEDVITILEKSLSDGEILFASRNDSIDSFFAKIRKPLPWEKSNEEKNPTISGETSSGSSTPSATGSIGNWVYPTLTSLSGNKSDRIMDRTYTAESRKIEGCTYENKLTFTHKHNYTKSIEAEIRRYLANIGIRDAKLTEKMLTIQGKGKNSTYMRIFVPTSSSLTGSTAGITSSSFPYAQEFAFTLETPIGGSASKVIRYMTTIPGCHPTQNPVMWYRQPGLKNTTLSNK